MQRTKLPAGLNECEIRVVYEERHRALKKLRLRLEVSVEDSYIVACLHIWPLHTLAQRAGLVSLSVGPCLVPDIDALACPALALHLHQILTHQHHKDAIIRKKLSPFIINVFEGKSPYVQWCLNECVTLCTATNHLD